MILKKNLFAPLMLTCVFSIVSTSFALMAQTSSSAVENAKVISFSMENSLVSRYLQHASSEYTDGIGRTGNSVLCYWIYGEDKSPYMLQVPETDGHPGWPEQCAPVVISAVKGGTVRVSESPSFNKYITLSATSSSVSIYNLKPQTIYWYKVLDSKKRSKTEGVFKTQDNVRMIHTEKVLNVRDIGGWKCDGGRLAYGKIYRGAALDGIVAAVGPLSSSDIKVFTNDLGIGSEIDLRSSSSLTTSPLGSQVAFKKIGVDHYLNLLKNTESKKKEGGADYYSKMANIIDLIISNIKANKGTYIHCTWGADRTGTVIALIEALCGVSEADIVKEWELSSFNAVRYTKYINVQEITYQYLDSNGKLQTKPSELRAMFEYLYDNYGGKSGASLKEQVTSWFKNNVFASRSDKGASTIAELRSLLIAPEVKSPFIVKSLKEEIGSECYSVTTESTAYFDSKSSKYVIPSTGKTADTDAFSCTDYINCSGYSYLLINYTTALVGAFYDSNKKYISSIEDTTASTDQVLFNQRQYSIPAKAAYVKLNMPNSTEWSAIFSVTPYL